jgi:4-diphosphocytidyl-2-C-methyl-D-erythritol kinase
MIETYLSPAKVNLFLKVLGKRPDGYHDLVSIVDIISLNDVLQVEGVSEDVVIVEDQKRLLPSGPANTIYRAAMLLKETNHVERGVRISVKKEIPIGAGLGGPSSNAATALNALVNLWNLPINSLGLTDLGSKIGADVPLFLYGKSCVMKGVGERITPIKIPCIWYVIIYPGIILHTKDVYGGLKIPLTLAQNDITLSGQLDTVFDVARMLKNDLEKVAFSLHPEIETLKERLQEAGAIGSLMSGSGSSVFGVFENEPDARVAAEKVSDSGSVFVVHSSQPGGRHGNHRRQDLSRE